MKEQDWINLIAEDAQRAANEYGYLPSVLIAQTCQETGYGETDLSQVGRYNVVGMKTELLNDTWHSDHWDGSTYVKETPEWYNGVKTYITDSFRIYSSYYHGLADYCQFMRDARYSKLGKYKYRDLLGTTDPYTLIEGVRCRGYCTDPEYSNAIMRIIRKHDLTQYDNVGTMSGNEKELKAVEKPTIINRIAENEGQVPAHNANTHKYLAIHYLGVDGENPDLYGGGYGGHFYVSKDGRCYQAAKVTDKLWHVGASSGFSYRHPDARNYNTIGIECACYSKSNGRWFFTEATQEACARLAAWIMSEYGIPTENLLRHGDITTKHCPAPYIDNPGETPNWTWERFKATVEGFLSGEGINVPSDPLEGLEGVKRLVGTGQKNSVNFTGVSIDVDGVRGKQTTANMIRCLQRAANLDWNSGLSEDGIIGPKTRKAFEGHYIKVGETQYMVTAVEIICYCLGRDPKGVENPGTFGDGLAAALNSRYLSGEDILGLVG